MPCLLKSSQCDSIKLFLIEKLSVSKGCVISRQKTSTYYLTLFLYFSLNFFILEIVKKFALKFCYLLFVEIYKNKIYDKKYNIIIIIMEIQFKQSKLKYYKYKSYIYILQICIKKSK